MLGRRSILLSFLALRLEELLKASECCHCGLSE